MFDVFDPIHTPIAHLYTRFCKNTYERSYGTYKFLQRIARDVLVHAERYGVERSRTREGTYDREYLTWR